MEAEVGAVATARTPGVPEAEGVERTLPQSLWRVALEHLDFSSARWILDSVL